MQNHWNSLEAFYDTIASLLIVSFLKYSNNNYWNMFKMILLVIWIYKMTMIFILSMDNKQHQKGQK